MPSVSRKIRIGVVNIGDELLKGFTINSNLSDIGNSLLRNGYVTDYCTVIRDSEDSIRNELENMIEKGVDILIMTGGLGPTVDDLTKKTVADFLGIGFVRSNEVTEHLKAYWSKRGGRMPEKVLDQAMIPEGSSVFHNEVGTAPGLNIPVKNRERKTASLILLPGPPREMNPMLNNHVIPFIDSLEGFAKTYTETIYVTGMPESNVEKVSLPFIEKGEFNIAYCASPEAVKIYISGTEKENVIAKANEIKEVLPGNILPEGITSPVEDLVYQCIEKNITISTAESCTGGLISSAITDIPGTSAVYKGSIISYSNEWKQNVLGVSENTIKQFGAVSKECAEEMVMNLCEKFGTDAGISVTGIAGPGGGTDEKPVGLVYIGGKYRNQVLTDKYVFPGTRKIVRTRTLHTACRLLRNLIQSTS